MEARLKLLEMSAAIVSAYVGHHQTSPDELRGLIVTAYGALASVYEEGTVVQPESKPEPKIDVAKSLTPDFIICLEDGKRFKSLKRHLRTHFNLSPEQYRSKWGLPSDYPMVAPNYAMARSGLAKRMRLGHRATA